MNIIKPRIRATFYAHPPPGVSIEELVEILRRNGNSILEVEEDRVKIGQIDGEISS